MRTRPSVPITIAVACSLIASGTANASCVLDPLTADVERRIQLGGQWVTAKITTQFSFSSLPSGKVRIEQNVTIATPIESVLEATRKSLQTLPNDECGSIGTYDGIRLTVEPPSLKLQVDFSAAQWACGSMDVPCPTTTNPFRWCTQEWKTRLGSGSGWAKVFLTPTMSQNTLSFSQTDQKHFDLDNDTKWMSGLLGTLTVGTAGLAAVALVGDYMKKMVVAYIRVSPMASGTDIEEIPGFPAKTDYAGFTRDITEKECFRISPTITFDWLGEIGSSLPTVPSQEVCIDHSSIEMQVRRSGNAKAPMACFIRSVLLERDY